MNGSEASATVRVAHIGWLASSHLARRAEGFARLGLHQLVLTDRVPEHLQGAPLPYGVAVLPAGLRRRPLEALAWVEERLAEFGAQVLHVHSTHFPAVLGMFCRHVPRLVSLWDFVYSRDPVSPLWHQALLEALRTGQAAEMVSFSSKVVMEAWRAQGFDPARGRWHSWGLDPEVFAVSGQAATLAALRTRLGIAPEAKILFSPRTPSLPANVDMALKVLPRLAGEVCCLVAGHAMPPEARYLEPWLRRKDIGRRVRILEPVRDVGCLVQMYQLADAVLSLHCNDNNPATVLEAMACGGVPVVAASSSVEYWVRDGQNGFVAPARDPGAIALTVERALSLEPAARQTMARRNRRRIVEEANFPSTLRQVAGDYAALAASSRDHQTLDDYALGLLADACGLEDEALDRYERAERAGLGGKMAERLAQEKRCRLELDAAAFHATRFDKPARALALAAPTERSRLASGLACSRHLFWHDQLAGLYPLAAAGDLNGFLDCLGHLEHVLHGHRQVWLSESVQWFGRNWGMWSFCADLLLAGGEEGGGLTAAVASTLAALPATDRRRPALARLLHVCGRHRLDAIHPDLDRRFRQEALAVLDGTIAYPNPGD